jgi:hypothetical protein
MKSLFKKFEKAIATKCVKGHEEEYIAMRFEGPGGPAGKIWQLGMHAGTQLEEWLRRLARFPELALDGPFQIRDPVA